MIYAIIAAGGIGARFGADKPKQLVGLGSESILTRTVKVFEKIDKIEKTVVACPEKWLKECRAQLAGLKKVCVISGGETRNETIMRGIDFIEESFGLDEKTLVVTHDAVRPYVTERLILDSIDAAERYGASVAAVEAVDTLIECENGFIENIPDRKKMFHVQTPQTFGALKLRRLYDDLTDEEKDSLTDCSKIFILRGEKVAVFKGDRANIKITYREDIQ
ncbi:MAG: D-ribitol-5-phosphate cytidylyltransferase [Acutalibacteraceae bacterium]|nr:D-ribitol-5-phosphate cytidylyltransferase [Oscillospiraceae bacterium]